MKADQHEKETLLHCREAGRSLGFNNPYSASPIRVRDNMVRMEGGSRTNLRFCARLLIPLSAVTLANCGQSADANDPSGHVSMRDASISVLNDCVSTLASRDGRKDAQALLSAGKSPTLYGHIEGPESTALKAPGIDGCDDIQDGRLAPLRLNFLKGKLDGDDVTSASGGRACLEQIYEYKKAFNLELLKNDPKRVRSICRTTANG